MAFNPAADDYAGFHRFKDWLEDNAQGYGSFEVFYDGGRGMTPSGWYWWACFPGCLPDGEPAGPFDTSAEAFNDAQEG